MKLTKNFSLEEFRCKDGSIDHIDQIQRLAINLQVLRDYLGKPIKINSGYRSPEYNAKIGGAKNSFHVKGMAADIVADGFTPKQLFDIIESLQNKGQMIVGGLKAYNTFVHYDIRGHLARW